MAIIFFSSDYHGGYGDFLFGLKMAAAIKKRLPKEIGHEQVYLVTQNTGKVKIQQLEGDKEFGIPVLNFEELNALQKNPDFKISYYIEGPVFHLNSEQVPAIPSDTPVLLIPEYGKTKSKVTTFDVNPAKDLEERKEKLTNPARTEINVVLTGFRSSPDEKGILLSDSLIQIANDKKNNNFAFREVEWNKLGSDFTNILNKENVSIENYFNQTELSFEYSSWSEKTEFNGGLKRFLKVHQLHSLQSNQISKNQDIVSIGNKKGVALYLSKSKPNISAAISEDSLFDETIEIPENAVELLNNQLYLYYDDQENNLAYIGKNSEGELIEGIIEEGNGQHQLDEVHYDYFMSQMPEDNSQKGPFYNSHLAFRDNYHQAAVNAFFSITEKRGHTKENNEKLAMLQKLIHELKAPPHNFTKIVFVDVDKNEENVLYETNSSDLPPKTYRLLSSERISHLQMLALQALSGHLVGASGDQSFGESISAGKLIVYECLDHKKRLAFSYINLVFELTKDAEVKELAELLLSANSDQDWKKLSDYFINKQPIVSKLINVQEEIAKQYDLVDHIMQVFSESLLVSVKSKKPSYNFEPGYWLTLLASRPNDTSSINTNELCLFLDKNLNQLSYVGKRYSGEIFEGVIDKVNLQSDFYNFFKNIFIDPNFKMRKINLLGNFTKDFENKIRALLNIAAERKHTPTLSEIKEDTNDNCIKTTFLNLYELIKTIPNINNDAKEKIFDFLKASEKNYFSQGIIQQNDIIIDLKGFLILLKSKVDDSELISKIQFNLFNLGLIQQKSSLFKKDNFLVDNWLKNLKEPQQKFLSEIGWIEKKTEQDFKKTTNVL